MTFLPSLLLALLMLLLPAQTSSAQDAAEEKAEILATLGMEFASIPGGEFQPADAGGGAGKPGLITVKGFLLGKTEVTVGQFRRFVEATGYKTEAETGGSSYTVGPEGFWAIVEGASWRSPGYSQTDAHPVVCISWNDANAFCDWVGGRLPTEMEWEYAAGNGMRHTKYSWGNDDPLERKVGNLADESARAQFGYWPLFSGYHDGFLFTSPAGSYPPNDFGLHDMTGNVWEWCANRYDCPYCDTSFPESQADPSWSTYRATRGGSWDNGPTSWPGGYRNGNEPGDRNGDNGFRVARDAPRGG
jgi:formylglycine-generating enzyme required for sulfatase activity